MSLGSCAAPTALKMLRTATHGFAVGYPAVAPNGARRVSGGEPLCFCAKKHQHQKTVIGRRAQSLAGSKWLSSQGIEKHFIAPPSSEHREEMRQQTPSFVKVSAALPIEFTR